MKLSNKLLASGASSFYRHTQGAVIVEFAFVFLLLISLIAFGNETFRITQTNDRITQLSNNISQAISVKYLTGITDAELANITQTSEVVTRPFIRNVGSSPCTTGPSIPNADENLNCEITFVRADDACDSNWRKVWSYGGTASEGSRCSDDCLTSISVDGRQLMNTSQYSGLSTEGRTAIVSWFYAYSPGVVFPLPFIEEDRLEYYSSSAMVLITDTFSAGTVDGSLGDENSIELTDVDGC